VLVLHKSPAPNIPIDAGAAARAEQKFATANQAKASGQPGQVALDRSELNSYLAQNLQTQAGAPGGAFERHFDWYCDWRFQAMRPGRRMLLLRRMILARRLAAGDLRSLEDVQSSVKDVKVDMAGDLVKAYVIFDFHGKDISLELDGH